MRQNTYYIRKPLPESAPISAAREWDDLIGRCLKAQTDDLLDAFRRIVNALRPSEAITGLVDVLAAGTETDVLVQWEEDGRQRLADLIEARLADESPSRYAHGIWTVAYRITDVRSPAPLSEFLGTLSSVAGHETGWPPWWVPTKHDIRPYPTAGLIECWMIEAIFANAAHSDLWRADPSGRMFLLRGYQEDCAESITPGSVLDLTLPVWRVGECLLHARRLAQALDATESTIDFMVRWSGLAGRELSAIASPERNVIPGRIIRQDETRTRTTTSSVEINDALPEVVRRLVEPLYTAFDFFQPPPNLYAEELAQRLRRFRVSARQTRFTTIRSAA